MNKGTTQLPHSNGTPKYLLVIGGVAVLAIIAVLAFYAIVFGFVLSESHEQWGQFGDYVGGALNPLLSFLALVALLITIAIQNRELRVSITELELTRKELKRTADSGQLQAGYFQRQEKRSDTYRIIETLSNRIEGSSGEPRLINNVSVWWMVRYGNWENHREQISEISIEYRDNKSETYYVINRIAYDLERLAHYIAQYEEFSDTTVRGTPLPEFYRMEFGAIAATLWSLQMIPESTYKYYCGQ